MSSLLADTGILPWLDLDYDEELTLKHSRVVTALSRARLPAEVRPVVPSPRRTGARARVSLHRGPGRTLGLYKPGTHDFVEVLDSGALAQLARPELVALATAVRGRGDLPQEAELRSDGERAVMVADVKLPADAWGLAAASGRDRDEGETRLMIDGLRVSPRSFYQVNLEVNRLIVAEVTRLLAEFQTERLLDLYAGVGNLSAPAARAGLPAVLVEEDRSSSTDARYNIDPRGHPRAKAEVFRQDLRKYEAGKWPFDVVVLDPPRAGAPGLLAKLATTRPRAMLYLSCDPVTLARDLATVLPLGYELASVTPFDMFPGADHIESLVVLTRPKTPKRP